MLIPTYFQITPIHFPYLRKLPLLLILPNPPTPQHKIMRKQNPQSAISLIISKNQLKLLNIQQIRQ